MHISHSILCILLCIEHLAYTLAFHITRTHAIVLLLLYRCFFATFIGSASCCLLLLFLLMLLFMLLLDYLRFRTRYDCSINATQSSASRCTSCSPLFIHVKIPGAEFQAANICWLDMRVYMMRTRHRNSLLMQPNVESMHTKYSTTISAFSLKMASTTRHSPAFSQQSLQLSLDR